MVGVAADSGARNTAVIADELAGRRIAVTGATGFVGTALVERLLRAVPGCEIVLLVRPGSAKRPRSAPRREILRNDCFDRLRGELGERFDEEMPVVCTTIAGDVGRDGLGARRVRTGRSCRSCDIVIHAAAAVSFDAPLDDARSR